MPRGGRGLIERVFAESRVPVLAHLEEEAAAKVLGRGALTRRTAKTLTDRRRLEADLARTRARGYAVNDEEFVPGLISIAAPLIGPHQGRVRGAVSFDFSIAEYGLEQIMKSYVKPLIELAGDISALLPPV